MVMIVCNVAWMKQYEGITNIDYPVNGGKFIDEKGFGHEVINFKKNGQFVYGYVQAKNATININRIGGADKDYVDNVLVVWRARSKKGSVIIGWYKNARVYRNECKGNSKRIFRYKNKDYYPRYLIRAKATDAFVIPVQHRHFSVPVTHRGFGSQTFVSFLDKDLEEVREFKQELEKYIQKSEAGNFLTDKRGKRGVVDTETKALIEKIAVDTTIEFYINQGYDVKSVESDNVGYDLLVSNKTEELHVEVKGTSVASQKNVNVTLTPNEYKTSNKSKTKYRIVIVVNTLNTPELLEFFWDNNKECWFSEQSLSYLSVVESISANLHINNG